MKSIQSNFYLLQLSSIILLAAVHPVAAEVTKDHSGLDLTTQIKESQHQVSISARDLLAQPEVKSQDIAQNLNQAEITKVTGLEVKQTPNGLELILVTAAGSERLVPLILPEGNDLVIDILDATLAFSIRNGVRESNPAPGITAINLAKVDESSIRLTITGESQTPSAEVVPGGDNLVLSVTPDGTSTAQEPDEEIEVIATGEAEDDDYNVDEASVGTKTDTPIQDIPQSIQVIPQEVIKDQQANNITEALRNVPGAVPANPPRSQFNIPNIRGFSGSATNDVFRRNGLRDALGTSNTGDTANIERIEVLKGPASVLFGQGSPGGVVNIVTKQPLREPFYAAEVGIGNYDFYRGAFDISGPLDEKKNVLYRLNFSAESAGSFVDFYDRDRYLVNPFIAWQIGDNTELTFEYEYRNVQLPNDFGLPAVGTVLDNPNGNIPVERYIGEPDIEERRDIQSNRFGYNLEHRFSENWRIRNAFDAVLRTENSINIFPAGLGEDGRTLEREYFNSLQGGFDVNTFTLDTYTVGKFNTGSIKHELVAGIELSRNQTIFNDTFGGGIEALDLFDPQYAIATLGEPDFIFDQEEIQDGLGIYLQDQITLSNKFIVLLGGRFDILSTETEDFVEDTVDFQQNEGFSPRVGLVYKPIEDISLYASYSRSLTQSVGTAFDSGIFEPERGTQYEIGVKGDISDRLSATLALYDLTRTNVTTEDPDNPNFEIQTGEQNSQGMELSVAGEILPEWNVTAGYAYTDAVITEDNTFEEGNRLNNAPENAVSLWTTYKLQQGSLEGLGFGAGIFFVGERQGDLDNSFQLPSYTRTDAAIFYERGKVKTAINFRNLFDIDYFETAENDLQVYPGTPFTVVGSVSYEF